MHYCRWRTHGDPLHTTPKRTVRFPIVDGRRTCSKCLADKPVEMFGRSKQHPNGMHPWCRVCIRAAGRAHYLANKARLAEVSLWGNRLNRYGITRDQYERLYAEQEGRCAICSGDFEVLAIDHDHSCCGKGAKGCGKCIRGLLCRRCNTILGMANDDTDRLLAAVAYLRGWSQSRQPSISTATACSRSPRGPSTSTRTRSRSC